ncbi:hypothetical protein NIES25_52270 [Nostoc linckia NIES-25]|nr:hypothetical protein NIES25_52270 [Nostoc linckia NIES-25]
MVKVAAYRLPEDLLQEIDDLSLALKTDKTAIVIEALKIGLAHIKGGDVKIERKTPLLPEEVQQMINESNQVLVLEIEELKKQINNLSK